MFEMFQLQFMVLLLILGILWFAMRMYVSGRDKGFQPDLPFEETPQF